MAGTLGRAFIQVFADLSKFTPGLRKEVQKALDEEMKGVQFNSLDEAAEKAGEEASTEIAKGVDKDISNKAKKPGEKGGFSLGKAFTTAWSSVMAAWLPTLIGLGIEIVSYLAPALAALGGAIPGAVVTAASAMAVLKMATNGVGAALKDAFDPAKAAQFNQAMQKLTPAARGFVMEIKNLHPAMVQLQRDVQQTFFVQMQGALTRMTRTLLPVLHTGLVQLSSDLGRMGRSLMSGLAGSGGDLASIFLAAHAALAPFIPLVGQLAQAFITIGAVAGPMVASLSGGLAGVLQKFVVFINAAANSGALAKFFDDALVILRNFGSLLGNVFGVINEILGALQQTGGQGLGVLSDLIGALGQFLATAEGHQFLVSLFTLLNIALSSLMQILVPLLPAVAHLATNLANGLGGALKVVTPLLVGLSNFLSKNPDLLYAAVAAWAAYTTGVKAATMAAEAFDVALNANEIGLAIAAIAAIVYGVYLIVKNWGTISKAVGEALDAVGGFFVGVWNWIKGVGTSIGNFFGNTVPNFFLSLPGKILNALLSLPTLLANLFMMALNAAGTAIGMGVGLLLVAIIKLPGLIWSGLVALGHIFVDLFKLGLDAAEAYISFMVNALIFVFTQLPGKIWNGLMALPGLLKSAFRTAMDWAKNEVEAGGNWLLDFAKKLPGRLGNFFGNVGHDILNGLKSGINSVISGFNHGIDNVAGFVHIGLPHIPLLAAGGLVNSPTLAVVGEAGPEAVVPLSDPAKAASVAKKTGLLDMLGSRTGGGNTQVHVYLGTREITDILDVRITKALDNQAQELAYGTR